MALGKDIGGRWEKQARGYLGAEARLSRMSGRGPGMLLSQGGDDHPAFQNVVLSPCRAGPAPRQLLGTVEFPRP